MKAKLKEIVCILVIFALVSCSTLNLFDFDLKEKGIEFKSGDSTLKGALVKPENRKSFPVVLFIHGDGKADRYQNGYYKYIWKELAQQGIGSMAWDKPGIGSSSGNWQEQTMEDRANEVVAAIRYLKQRTDIKATKIVIWGISQGGWVAPKVYNLASSSVDGVILQSAAVNWLKQGKYHLKCQVEQKQYSSEQKAKCVAFYDAVCKCLEKNNYQDYEVLYKKQSEAVKKVFSKMKKQRWVFVQKNYKTDITSDLKKVDCPVLGLFGNKDENVNTQESFASFLKIFEEKGNDNYEGVLFNNADHSLFNIDEKGKTGSKEDVWYKLLYKGEDVFTPGFLNEVLEFVGS